jgi:hypothetical protein
MKIHTVQPLTAGKAATPRVGLLRLERLALILEKAHRVHSKLPDIDIQYVEKDTAVRDQVCAYRQQVFAHACGTPACALGHYAYNTPTRWGWSENGLRGALDFAFLLQVPVSVDGQQHFLTGTWKQTMHEFAITFAECLELFDTRGCGDAQNAKEAAKYIRNFVKRKRKALGLKKRVRS